MISLIISITALVISLKLLHDSSKKNILSPVELPSVAPEHIVQEQLWKTQEKVETLVYMLLNNKKEKDLEHYQKAALYRQEIGRNKQEIYHG